MKLVNLNEAADDFKAPKGGLVFSNPKVVSEHKTGAYGSGLTVYDINYMLSDAPNALGIHFRVIIFDSETSSHIDAWVVYPDMDKHEPGTYVCGKGEEEDVVADVLKDVSGDFSDIATRISTNPDSVLRDLMDPTFRNAKNVQKDLRRIEDTLHDMFD